MRSVAAQASAPEVTAADLKAVHIKRYTTSLCKSTPRMTGSYGVPVLAVTDWWGGVAPGRWMLAAASCTQAGVPIASTADCTITAWRTCRWVAGAANTRRPT
eukprot:COSAG01_NODE_37_length_34085_cov_64.376626_9_plen_102_part_00